MSVIKTGTTTTTGYVVESDTNGNLVIQTGSTPTTALTLGDDQSATFAGSLINSAGTANGVLYLNGSKALTTGSALVFDGTNLGLGVTPSAWEVAAGRKAIEVGSVGNGLYGYSVSNFNMSSNAYFNSGWKYASSGSAASYYNQSGGVHAWYTAPSGTAGDAITFSQAMTLDASGNLGVGVTTIYADAKLHVGGPLRAGSASYDATPYSTLFSNTLAANGSNRVVNFDGNGASSTSVWWTNGTRALGAIDASTTNNLQLYANDGTSWQKQVNINYGSVDLLTTTNATGGVMTVSNPSGSSYDENLRLPRAGGVNYTSVCLATDPAAYSGTIDGQFTLLVFPSSVDSGQFSIRHHHTDVLTIQKAGYVSTPLNPAFEAKGDSGRVDSTLGWSKVLYSQNVNQRGTAYSSGLSRFTAPIAGWYQFNAQWSAENNSDTDGTFTFAINGSLSDNKGTVSMPTPASGNYDGHTMAATMYLALNDYVEVYRYSTVSTTSRSNDWQGWFSGHFIG